MSHLSPGSFINSAQGQVSLYMMAGVTHEQCSGTTVSSVSGRAAVGIRLGRAVGRGAGRSSRAVGLRGFASLDVLNYCLAVFGVSVANYSDSSPQASGQLGKVG